MTKPSEIIVPLEHWINDKSQWGELTDYLRKESRLPGPQANLGLSESFAKHFATSDLTDTAWELLVNWSNPWASEVDTNDPLVFLTFCAIRASGAYYGYAKKEMREEIQSHLKSAMNDSRWRVREAAAMGLQSIGEFEFALLSQLLETWKYGANLLEQRAFLAALAHPPILKNKANARYSLNLAAEIMEELLSSPQQKENPEHLRVLSKALEYALSVFVASEPEEGFNMLRHFAMSRDSRMTRIVKSNLGKARLSKKYASQVADILEVMAMN